MPAEVRYEDVIRQMDRYSDGFLNAAGRAGEEIAALLETHAKNNHPWEAKTGATDTSTRGFVMDRSASHLTVALTAGMEYDVLLELAHRGKWAWLRPAVDANVGRIREILAKHLGGGR